LSRVEAEVEELELTPRRVANSQTEHLRVQPARPKGPGKSPQDSRLDASIGIPGVGERGPSPDLGGEIILALRNRGRGGHEVVPEVRGLVLEIRQDHVPDPVAQSMGI